MASKKRVKKAASKKASVKKASVKRASVKKASVKRASVKRASTGKSPAKKSPVKKSPVKKSPAKKPSAKSRADAAAAARIESITPTKDGAFWTLKLGSGVRVKVAASAAQSAGAKVGGSWSAALAKRVLEAAIAQEMFNRAMSMLAQDGRMGRAALVEALGGDGRARKTVASLAAHGWTA